jgi:hypothetical protein
LGGGGFFLVVEDDAPVSNLRNGQHLVMVAVGGGGVLVMDAATGSASYKGKRSWSSMAIDGGTELEAAVASDTAPLMAAQSWKQWLSLFPMQASELARGAGVEEAAVSGRQAPGKRGGGGHVQTTRSVCDDANCAPIGPCLRPCGQPDEKRQATGLGFFSQVKKRPN